MSGSPVRIWPSAPALKPHSERFIEEIRTDRSASKRQVDEQKSKVLSLKLASIGAGDDGKKDVPLYLFHHSLVCATLINPGKAESPSEVL